MWLVGNVDISSVLCLMSLIISLSKNACINNEQEHNILREMHWINFGDAQLSVALIDSRNEFRCDKEILVVHVTI